MRPVWEAGTIVLIRERVVMHIKAVAGWHGQTLFVRVFSISQRFARTNEFVHATT
jgi:hypothetical protein